MPSDPPPSSPIPPLAQSVITQILSPLPEYRAFCNGVVPASGLTDFFFSDDPAINPATVFQRLRWGGCFVFVSKSKNQTLSLASRLPDQGFSLETRPAEFIRDARFPFMLWRKTHYFIARKTQLLLPGQDTDRFTYQVSLVPHGDPHEPLVVLKEVPSTDNVVARLKLRFPDIPLETIQRRARKFTEKIFPTFLTREAAILMILQEHLPAPYDKRVPRVIDLEKDDRGFVRRLKMNWLRNAGPALTQMDFAHQSADLLRAIHDIAGVIHLDLRLDNFVITKEGVGFVDFGSSVRINENITDNPLLHNLFDELMRTSQIQQMLSKMTKSGEVTSAVISRGYQKADKAVDLFYLALQFNSPHANPDLASFILYDPQSDDAKKLYQLTRQVLKPADPQKPVFQSAKDILHGIERIMLKLP